MLTPTRNPLVNYIWLYFKHQFKKKKRTYIPCNTQITYSISFQNRIDLLYTICQVNANDTAMKVMT